MISGSQGRVRVIKFYVVINLLEFLHNLALFSLSKFILKVCIKWYVFVPWSWKRESQNPGDTLWAQQEKNYSVFFWIIARLFQTENWFSINLENRRANENIKRKNWLYM